MRLSDDGLASSRTDISKLEQSWKGRWMSKHEDSITEGAKGLLVPGEEIVSALVVSPRGSSTAAAPGLAPGEIGRRWSNKNREAAKDVGLVVKRNSGLALTNRRLLTLDLAISATGGIKEVKDMLSEVPLDQVEEIKSRWNVLTISAGEAQFKLECKPPAAKAFARAFAATKAAASG
jgi:hypothetical protein